MTPCDIICLMNKHETAKTIAWYNENAPRYTRAIREIVSVDQMADFFTILPAKAKILDAGCGGGRDSELFANMGHQVVGLDLSTGMLLEAKKQNNFQNFANASHLNLPLQSNFLDGIWAHASLHHMDSHDSFAKAVKEFHRTLQSEGILHLATQAQTSEFESRVVLDTLTNHERFYI